MNIGNDLMLRLMISHIIMKNTGGVCASGKAANMVLCPQAMFGLLTCHQLSYLQSSTAILCKSELSTMKNRSCFITG